jgi:hypothetical protein
MPKDILDKFEKTSTEVQDYDVDFVEYLRSMDEDPTAGHTAAASVSPSGLTLVATTILNGVIKVKTSGGTAGIDYVITTLLTTVAGRVHEGRIEIKVRD